MWPKNTLFTLKNISAYKHMHPKKIYNPDVGLFSAE